MLPPKYAGLDDDPPWLSLRRLWVGAEVRRQDLNLAKTESAAASTLQAPAPPREPHNKAPPATAYWLTTEQERHLVLRRSGMR